MDKKLLEFATPRQAEFLEAYWEAGTASGAARILGINEATVRKGIKRAKTKATLAGYAPEAGLDNPVAVGLNTKKISALYDEDGNIKMKWVISDRERENLTEVLDEFKDGLKDEFKGLHAPIQPPKSNNEELMACYIVGDQHYGAYAWGEETLVEDWDTDLADKVLHNAFDKLCSRASDAHYGMLVNVGDFLHANDTTSATPASKHLLDTDGRFGRTIRLAGRLFKHIVGRMLQVHQEVIIVNARGNHDPDAALWLNEMLAMYYQDDPRVIVVDNYSKFIWRKFGKNLIVTHHGDRLKAQRAYESITMNLAEEWGSTKHRFFWTGHIHHKQAQEIGGLLCESFNVLPPPDAWHAASGYGSSRSMTCIMLHKENGVDCRFQANIDELR